MAKFPIGKVPVTLVVKSIVLSAIIAFVTPSPFILKESDPEFISILLLSTFTDKVEVEPKSISLPVDDKPEPGTTVTESCSSHHLILILRVVN